MNLDRSCSEHISIELWFRCEHTPIILPSRRGSDDLATTVDASEIHDTTEVVRLASPVFSQERKVSAENWSVCKILKWKGKEFCPNKEAFMNTFSKKLRQD